jgi:hypothetical protein
MSHDSEKRRLLHLVTRDGDPLVQTICAEQEKLPGIAVQVISLTGAKVDYDEILTAIFEADSIQVW